MKQLAIVWQRLISDEGRPCELPKPRIHNKGSAHSSR